MHKTMYIKIACIHTMGRGTNIMYDFKLKKKTTINYKDDKFKSFLWPTDEFKGSAREKLKGV